MAGDGPAQSDFSRMMERLDVSIADRVTLTGALGRTGIEEVWRTHDVCLLTSAYEGMPLALLEAMAAGVCPVVMAVESGLPELLEDGINARIIPQGDAGAMAEVLRELSADRAQVERLGRAARETVRMRFSPEAHFKRLGEIIEELWSMPAPDPSKAATDPTATAVADIVDQLKQAERPVIVFGVGMFGRKVVDACMDVGLTVCALFDSDSARHGLSYRGIECRSPEDFSSIVDGVVAIGSLQLADGMRAQVADIFAQAGKRLPEMVSARS
ncbi:MAG: glycosyltransferase family 4 protein [Opitutaceae bacterium]